MGPAAGEVSIGLPVYNGERFLAQALDSLLAQTVREFELIICDNASTDATPEICRAYAAKDARIRYVRNATNVGVYRNFNKAFALSTGKYFKWAAADDIADPRLLERCFEVLTREPAVVVVYPKTRFIDGSGNPLPIVDPGWDLRSADARERFQYVVRSGHWCNLFYGLTRRDALLETRLFPPYSAGDYRLAGELSLLGQFRETQDPLLCRRIHAAASSGNHDTDWHTEFTRGRKGHPGLPQWHRCWDHSVTVARSGLDVRSKLALQRCILGRMYGGKRGLLKELRVESLWLATAALRVVGRAVKSADSPVST